MTRSISTRIRLAVAMLGCALAGVAAGTIANASASSASVRHHGAAAAHRGASARHHGGGWAGRRPRRLRALARGVVEGSFVVATRQGFVTMTVARGSFVSLSSQQLTINEGTPKQTYKADATITLPAKLVVRNNGSRSTASSLQAGERVTLIEGPHRALLLAHTPAAG